MKISVKRRKQDTPNEEREGRKAGIWKYAAIGLGATLAGIALAQLAIHWLVLSPRQSGYEDRILQLHLSRYVASVDQRIRDLNADIARWAQQPQLAEALQSADAERLSRAARRIEAHWPAVMDAKLFAKDRIRRLPDNEPPIGFAALDIMKSAKGGKDVAAEMHPLENGQALYMADAVHAPGTDDVLGVLLVILEPKALNQGLDGFEGEAGYLELVQSFGASSPEQRLISGGPSRLKGGQPMSAATANPNWSLRFHPADGLAVQSPSLFNFWVGSAVLALIALIAGLFGVWLIQRSLRQDSETMAQQLISGQSQKAPKFDTDVFDAIWEAWQHTQFSAATKRGAAKQTAEAQAKPNAGAPVQNAASESAGSGDPLLEDTEVLDLDLSDDDAGLFEAAAEAQDDGPPQPQAPESPAQTPAAEMPAEIFRAYDIRGVVNDTLTPDTVKLLGQALGTVAQNAGDEMVLVARDGRLSGPTLHQAMMQGIQASGAHAVDIGMVPTPLLYYATHRLNTGSGVMITGSHNPPEYNGLKMVVKGEALYGDDIQALKRRIDAGDLLQGKGQAAAHDITEQYASEITSDVMIAKPLQVVVDCGNGVTGAVAPSLLSQLGCEVTTLYGEVDGNFPNHHPDPGKPANLEDLKQVVKHQQADLGLAFDGDGDRLGVITPQGHIIWPDRLMMYFAQDVLTRNPGADIVFDVKCSRALADVISDNGGVPVMWRTGHSLIKAKLRENGAPLAGEMSGHLFFNDRWPGFDDAIYAAARLIELLSADMEDADAVFARFPELVSTPELNIEVSEASKFKLVERLKSEASFESASVNTIDGLRVDFADGWGLVRASNTTPTLVTRFEARDNEALSWIQQQFRLQLLALDDSLELPF